MNIVLVVHYILATSSARGKPHIDPGQNPFYYQKQRFSALLFDKFFLDEVKIDTVDWIGVKRFCPQLDSYVSDITIF